MPKINVYLPEELAAAVRDAQLPVSGICQAALERAVRGVSSARGVDEPPSEVRPGVLFARFTGRARTAITLAEKTARDVPHNYLGTEHVLLGIIDEGGNLAIKVLASLDVEVADLRAELVASMGPPAAELTKAQVPFTPLAKRALELTTTEGMSLGHNYIGTEHLLLGLLATEEGLASKVLRRMGLELRTTRRAVVTALISLAHARQDAPIPRAVAPDAFDQILRRLDAIEQRLAG